jgi:hypothetical protein
MNNEIDKDSEYRIIADLMKELKEDMTLNTAYINIFANFDPEKTMLFPDLVYILLDAIPEQKLPEKIYELICHILYLFIDEGDDEAALCLGSLYYTGRNGEQSYEKAVEYYKKSSDAGNLQATQNLGYCYYYGRTGEKDYEAAYKCFAKCAILGDPTSEYKLGDMYLNGYFVEKDENEAFRLYNNSYDDAEKAEYGSPDFADICSRMGMVYHKGIGTEIDLQKSLHYYHIAEEQYYLKITGGDYFAPGLLKNVLKNEAEIQSGLKKTMPDFEWKK